jgi:hypothetical protein
MSRKPRPLTDDEIEALLLAGWNSDRIAYAYGVPRPRVDKVAFPIREALKKRLERQPLPIDTRTLTQRAFGDPLPGRSALDKKGKP